ncbi:TetR/AcrR family transcriptional regulator [Nocardioides speluncae]|uniref:TetR/AcrR family transcriptional regulator n=1 Tax=Nocardioides speluncae TaxID=2670337 RepID=UPI0019824AE5|nr:TetR/AcrR family transcriptional regulator [Nocardioides speluncae]
MARTRLSPDQRRGQLLDLGAELFADEPYEQVHIERVAEMAGVSRGLLYHYFPTKRVFFASLVERALDSMLAATAPDPALTPIEQLRHGIDAYLRHFQQDQHGMRAIMRAAVGGDQHVLDLIERNQHAQEERILAVLVPSGTPSALLVITIRAWQMFNRTACLEWLDQPDVPREEVRELCVKALVSALISLPTDAIPVDLEKLLS